MTFFNQSPYVASIYRTNNDVSTKNPRMVQSANIPIHTAIGPISHPRIKNVASATRHPHITIIERIMEYLTSPAARIPYGGTNANTHTRGFTIVMAHIISQHICVPATDILPKNNTGFVMHKYKQTACNNYKLRNNAKFYNIILCLFLFSVQYC